MSVEIDGYSESNIDYWIQTALAVQPSVATFSALGQTFMGKAGYSLDHAQVYFGSNTGAPVGNLVAVIYAMAGTYGTNGVPSGPPLAKSNPVSMASLAMGLVTFTFPTPLALADQPYCLSIEAQSATTLDASNYPNTGVDSTVPSAPGNMFRYGFGAWTTPTGFDMAFHVFGNPTTAPPPPPPPTTPTNQVVNGDFTQGLTAWYDQAENGGFISIDNTISTVPVLKDSPTPYNDRSTWPQQRTAIRTDGTQTVVARAWVKTEQSTDVSDGARVGIDFREGETMTKALASSWVPWGSDWTLATVTMQCPAGSDTVIPWVQAMLHDNPASAYFKYVEMYVLEPGQTAPAAHAPPPPAASPATYQLTILAATGGTTSPASGAYAETAGSNVSVMETPNQGYKLVDWQLDGVSQGTANPLNILMEADHTVQPVFALNQITLSVAADVNGSVSPSGPQTLIIGQSYQFAALPNPGYQFGHWNLGGTSLGSSNPLPLVADATLDEKTLTAIFTAIPPVQVTMNIATLGNGAANLSNGPHTFNVGDIVTFTAAAAVNNAFREWTLDGVLYLANPASIQITQGMNGLTLTAVFNQTAISLQVAAGSFGSVAPAGPLLLQVGQQSLFSATPDPGYEVDHWNLGTANIGSTALLTLTATVDMDQKTLTVLFTAIPPQQITMNVATAGSGTVNPAPGVHTLNVGDTVQFMAIPAAGQTFKRWLLDGTVESANPLPLTITADMQGKTLTAEFTTPQVLVLYTSTVGAIILGISDAVLVGYAAARVIGLI